MNDLFLDVNFLIVEREKHNNFQLLTMDEKKNELNKLLLSSGYNKIILENIMLDANLDNFEFFKEEGLKEVNENTLLLDNLTKLEFSYSSIEPLNEYFYLDPKFYFTNDNYNKFSEDTFIKEFYSGNINLGETNSKLVEIDDIYESYILKSPILDWFCSDVRELYRFLVDSNQLNDNINFIKNAVDKINESKDFIINRII